MHDDLSLRHSRCNSLAYIILKGASQVRKVLYCVVLDLRCVAERYDVLRIRGRSRPTEIFSPGPTEDCARRRVTRPSGTPPFSVTRCDVPIGDRHPCGQAKYKEDSDHRLAR